MNLVNQFDKIPSVYQQFLQNNPIKKTCIILIGFTGSGKSTLCQLFKAYIQQNKHEKLKFQDGKIKSFQLQGVISSSSLKPQTISPKLYEIHPTNKYLQPKSILDTAPYLLPPPTDINRKWTSLDSKISFNYLIEFVQSASFVLMVEEKYTRSKMQGLKTILESFLEFFTKHPKQLLDNTAIIISRCAATLKKDSLYTRLESCIKKINPAYHDIGQIWLQSLKNRDGLIIQYKFTTQQAAKQQTIAIYNQLSKLQTYQLQKQNVCTFDKFSQEITKNYEMYMNVGFQVFQNMMLIVPKLINGNISQIDQFIKSKNDICALFAQQDNKTKKMQTNLPENKQQSDVIPQLLDCLYLYVQLSDMCNKSDNSNDIIYKIAEKFQCSKLISQQEDIYTNLRDRGLLLKRFPKAQITQNFHNHLKNSTKNNNFNKKQLMQKLIAKFQSGQDNEEYYHKYKKVIDYFYTLKEIKSQKNKLVQNLKIKVQIQLAGLASSEKSLPALLDLMEFVTQIKNIEMLSSVYEKMAKKLLQIQQLQLAIKILCNCTNPQSVIKIMDPIIAQKQSCLKFSIKTYLPYIKFLQESGLAQKSYETCYRLGDFFQQISDRKFLGQYLKEVPKNPSDAIINAFIKHQAIPVQSGIIQAIRLLDIQK